MLFFSQAEDAALGSESAVLAGASLMPALSSAARYALVVAWIACVSGRAEKQPTTLSPGIENEQGGEQPVLWKAHTEWGNQNKGECLRCPSGNNCCAPGGSWNGACPQTYTFEEGQAACFKLLKETYGIEPETFPGGFWPPNRTHHRQGGNGHREPKQDRWRVKRNTVPPLDEKIARKIAKNKTRASRYSDPQLLSKLFTHGRPRNDPSETGLIVHCFDATENPAAAWMPADLCYHNNDGFGFNESTCSHEKPFWSTSIINWKQRNTYAEQKAQTGPRPANSLICSSPDWVLHPGTALGSLASFSRPISTRSCARTLRTWAR